MASRMWSKERIVTQCFENAQVAWVGKIAEYNSRDYMPNLMLSRERDS